MRMSCWYSRTASMPRLRQQLRGSTFLWRCSFCCTVFPSRQRRGDGGSEPAVPGTRGGPSSLSLHGLPQCRPREASKAPAPQLSPTPAQHLHDHDGISGCVQEAVGPGLVAAEIGVMEAQEEDVGWQVWGL